MGKFYSEKLSIPLLISGGLTASDRISEAFVIKNHLNLKNIIIEQNSRNTFESARNLSKYCEKEIGPFLLITGDAHILRSYLTFKSHKCEVLIACRRA